MAIAGVTMVTKQVLDGASSIHDYGTRIRNGALTITDEIERCFAEIEKRNDELNIVTRCLHERAEKRAKVLEEELNSGSDRGLMHGVPIAVKDIFAISGHSPSAGSCSPIRFGNQESTVIKKLEASGAIILGVLNLDEFAAGGTGSNAWYGRCKNPLDRRRMTGGSSSGSAAAVSAGFCLATIGSDAGGSIRIPAAFCGVCGLKPTYGRVSRFGSIPRTWSMDCIGPLTTNIEDLGIALEAISGHDVHDTTSVPENDFTWRVREIDDVPRIGYLAQITDYGEDYSHYGKVLESLEQAGYQLKIKDLHKLDTYTEYHQRIVKSEAAAFHRAVLEEEVSNVSIETQDVLKPGGQILAIDYLQALTQRDSLLAEFLDQVLNDVDVLVLPVSYEEAPVYESGATKDADLINQEFARASIFTRFVNFLGLPAVSLPVGIGSAGMPTAVQLIARPFDELRMLNIALQMESLFAD
jgi:aspartyl-tRNA(Asn)/glutamyl-tRNA(Gln) amidotransferase subunit A